LKHALLGKLNFVVNTPHTCLSYFPRAIAKYPIVFYYKLY